MGALREIRLHAHAKVNYALEVVGLRGDGYHEIRLVTQSVSLADEVRIEKAGGGFGLRVEPEGVGIGPPEENTAYRAWRLLGEHTGEGLPVRVTLRKNIPAGAGLGGGSADAAAVLRGLDRLFGLGLGIEELRGLGQRIGADVPFCFSGGTALAEGVGEKLTPLPAPPGHRLLIAKPFKGADTGGIYRAFDAKPSKPSGCVEPVVAALGAGDLKALALALGNDLAPTTKNQLPEVAALEDELREAGALGASMTGSGTAVFGIFRDAGEAEAARAGIRTFFSGVYAPVTCGSRETGTA